MKRIFAVIVLAGLSIVPVQASQDSLTNDEVIKMTQAKLPDSVIVAKIKASASCNFDTSADALLKLKQAGISDTTLEAMVQCGAAAAPSTDPAPDANDLKAPHDPGIYYFTQTDRGAQMKQLDPTAYSGSKSGGMFASAMTYGLHKMKMKADVRGARASLQVEDDTPVFYFYFEQKHSTLSYPGTSLFGGLSTPNQFTLVRLESKKDSRELIVGEFGTLGVSSGTRDKDVIALDYQKIAPGVYKVTPKDPLKKGEYCFFYTGQNVAMSAGGGSLFDFGVV